MIGGKKFMRIKEIREIEPVMANCISVDAPDKLFAVGNQANLLTHNSVSQRNVIIGCLLRPKNWVILGIDLKRVELTMFKKFGVKVATDLETAVEFLRFAQAVMMKRYERMEELGVNDFEDLPEDLQALLVMIDEAGELLSPTGAKALSENTKIMTSMGYKLLKYIQIGDVVLDNHGKPTKVTGKYEPIAQNHYKMNISKDGTKESEEFIAGEEHYWVVYYVDPAHIEDCSSKTDDETTLINNDTNKHIEGPFLLETWELKELIDEENNKPINQRKKLKIKKYGQNLSM